MFQTVTLIMGALACSLAGLLLAFRAWQTRRNVGVQIGATAAFWGLATLLWSIAFGPEIGIALALESGALLAFAFILIRAERRDARAPRDRVVAPSPKALWARSRGFARFLVGGPLAMMAAMGIAIVIAVGAPLHEQTRLILAGLIVPTLWAIMILYSLLERRLLRSTGVLIGVTTAGFGLAFLVRA